MIPAPVMTVTDVVADFLSTAPSTSELLAWRLPDEWQQKASDLLDKVKSESATAEDLREVDEFRRVNHLMILVKARAQMRLRDVR
jgi:hypothetical protein